jgi:hypothetical protein
VASLPSFRLFPWFFVLPGLLTAGLALGAGRRQLRPGIAPVAASGLRTERAA